MADLRVTVDQAVKVLQDETQHYMSIIAERGSALERELRQVAAALEGGGPPGWDVAKADGFHVFEATVRTKYPEGFALVLSLAGMEIGSSVVRKPLEAGRYKVILQMTKLETRPGEEW